MKLVFGSLQGLELAQRFAADRFGQDGFQRAARVEQIGWGSSPGSPYRRFLAGELQALDFDGHAVDIDDMAEYGGEVRYLDLVRDGLVEGFLLEGDIAHYALGARVVVRWIESRTQGRQCVEIWADLDDADCPVVTHPAL